MLGQESIQLRSLNHFEKLKVWLINILIILALPSVKLRIDVFQDLPSAFIFQYRLIL